MSYVPNFTSSIPATDYVYTYLDRNQELVISSVDLHPDNSDLYDSESNFGKCELQKEDAQEWYEKCKHIRTVRFQGIIKPTTCQKWFSGCENLTEIKNMENLDTSECTDMSSMFFNCESLTTLDVSNFDTNNVTDMDRMFTYCESLTKLDSRNFDTSKVTDMSYMFGCCTSLATLNLSNFNTNNVTNMNWMFDSCPNLSFITCPQSVKDKITSLYGTISSNPIWTIV